MRRLLLILVVLTFGWLLAAPLQAGEEDPAASSVDLDELLAKQRAELIKRRQTGDKPAIATSLVSIGWMLGDQGKLEEAHEALSEAHQIRMSLGDQSGISETLRGLGRVYLRKGDLAKARDHFLRARELAMKTGHRYGLAALAGDLGDVYLRLGDLERAATESEQALRAARELGDPFLDLEAQVRMAQVYAAQGKHAQALAAVRGIATMVGRLAAVTGALPALRKLRAVAIRAAHETSDPAALAWSLELGRELLARLAGRAALAAAVLPREIQTQLQEAHAAVREARDAYRRALAEGTRRQAWEARRNLKSAEDHLLRTDRRRQGEANRAADLVMPEPASLAEIQASLKPGQAFVLYGITGSKLLALVLTKTASRAVEVGALAPIEAAVKALAPEPNAALTQTLDKLRTLLVEPLGLGADTKVVLVSPAGYLWHVPFGVLLDRPVALTPSASTHLLLGQQGDPGEGVLAVGDPATKAPRLTALPGTRAEAEAIGDVTLLGERASESALPGVLGKQARWRALHLACHALIDTERPLLSALALAPDEKNDGYLTALEIARMTIPVDLVSLSSDKAARGKTDGVDGLIGLPRAFLLAGAPRVIAPLWSLDDEAARALMVAFYEAWNPKQGQGLGAAAALRKAQEHVRAQAKWKHPYYWAGWVLWGLAD